MKIKLSKSQWAFMGKKAGWMGEAEGAEIDPMFEASKENASVAEIIGKVKADFLSGKLDKVGLANLKSQIEELTATAK